MNDPSGATLLGAHFLSARSPSALLRRQRRITRALTRADELAFARTMRFIGSARSAGFGAGWPHLGGLVVLSAWRNERPFHALHEVLHADDADASVAVGWMLAEVTATRGSHYGHRPLAAAAEPSRGGPVVALTLGRSHARRLPRFLAEGMRLDPHRRRAAGLVAAVSAGSPLTGNCTVSVWRSEHQMLDYAYREAGGHVAAAHAQPPILVEQLNARARPLALGGQWKLGVADAEALNRLRGGLG